MSDYNAGRTRCSICDEWYDERGERASVHRHPEPQSGLPRHQLMASRMSYRDWVFTTPEGMAWYSEDMERRWPS